MVRHKRRKCQGTARNLVSDPKCGKPVKLFVYGTKVLFLIPQAFHHNNLKEFWPIL